MGTLRLIEARNHKPQLDEKRTGWKIDLKLLSSIPSRNGKFKE
jgi:hypothetical protein